MEDFLVSLSRPVITKKLPMKAKGFGVHRDVENVYPVLIWVGFREN